MRIVFMLPLAVVLTGSMLAQSASEPSLADLARKQRAAKARSSASHVITNDDLPKSNPAVTTTVSTSDKPDSAATADGQKPSASATASKDATKDAAKDPTKDKDKKESQAASSEPTGAEETYRTMVQDQRAEINKLQQEIGAIEHNQRVQSTNAYLDAGSRLRDPKKFADEREKQDKDIEAKQDKLKEARAKLDDILEQARKLGIPSSALE